MANTLETVEIQTQKEVQYSIIWLHGLGANANDFIPIMPELHFGNNNGVRFIFPNAPIRPITVNNGMAMRGWYDILSLERLETKQDEKGLYASKALIDALIQKETQRGIPTHRIFLVGFSQGCAMTLLTGLRYPKKLAGLIGLSGYLPLASHTAVESSPANKDIPILLTHGEFDPVVPIQLAQESHQHLVSLGYHVEWHQYPMAHQVCAEEIADINTFLLKHMK